MCSEDSLCCVKVQRKQLIGVKEGLAISGLVFSLHPAEVLRWGKTYWQVAAEQAERPKVDIEVDAQIEGSLAAEASLVVLDSLELLVQTVSLQSMLGKVGSYWSYLCAYIVYE